MSDPEGFLARWTRRKRDAKADDSAAARKAAERTAAPATEAKPDDAPRTAGGTSNVASQTARDGGTKGSAAAPRTAGDEAHEAFDAASLPPIESITSASDIRAFLAPGVPEELTRAALRRAWSADPAIRDFVGIAENQWDFTVPNEILGFGPLDNSEDVARLVAKVFGERSPDDGTETDDRSVSAQAGGEKGAEAEPADQAAPPPSENVDEAKSIVQRSENKLAMPYSDHSGDDLAPAQPRGHGRALPQ